MAENENENENLTFMELMTNLYVVFAVMIMMFLMCCHLSKKCRKYFKLCMVFDIDRVMDEGLPLKAILYMEPGAKGEIRRFSMEKNVFGKYKQLMLKLREVFPQLKSKSYTIYWKDEDDDEVIMSSDHEVWTMFTQSIDTVLKLTVRCNGPKTDDEFAEVDAPKTSTQSIHQGIVCDGCGIPVVGFRYRCITCDDFDLCARCENEGKHPEHCVVRVPIPNMSLPLIKATIKKSRRFLKSVASRAHEESKRLRRERGGPKYGSDGGATNSRQQDSQAGPAQNWVAIFGSYLEEFTNLAGDYSRSFEKKSEPEATNVAGDNNRSTEKKPEPEATKREKSAATEPKILSSDQISLNPWNLPQADLEKLRYACKYMQENTLQDTLKPLTKAFDRVLEIATTAAEEAVTLSPSRAPIRERSLRKISRETAPQSQQETPKSGEVPRAVNEALAVGMKDGIRKMTPNQEAPKEPAPGTSGLAQSISELAKLTLSSANGTLVAASQGEHNMSELINAVNAAKAELSSNASSCSSGRGYDKAEGWTLINENYDEAKDLMNYTDDCSAENDVPESQERADESRYFAPIYPPLNAATAVTDPNEADDVAPVASAPPMTKVAPVTKTAPKANPTPANPKAAGTAEATPVLRSQLAPHVEAALLHMENMGFCNQSGWLTQLLHHNDGNISAVLDLLTPVHANK